MSTSNCKNLINLKCRKPLTCFEPSEKFRFETVHTNCLFFNFFCLYNTY